VGEYFLELQARITLDLLAPWPRATVLDVGGGHGQLAAPLASAGYDVTVHGTAEACAERVRDLVQAGRARFGVGALEALPWPDRSFDVVLAFRLLPHVARWQALVGELCRLARLAVVVDYPTRRSVNAVSGAFFEAKKGVEGNTRPFRVFGEREIGQAFEAASFATTARRPEFTFPMALHRAIGRAGLSRTVEAVAAGVGVTSLLGSPVVRRAERRG
jgi:2-polyprenyl-3-methyl-5-hydroxy-6-metoxy-1,4-benzoquinol methylase